jgi:putative selenate reductase molybdopterin-binding subunit
MDNLTLEQDQATSEGPFAVFGTSAGRVDGRGLVTGAPVYTVDYEMPGMLHARILRSPHPHARVLLVDPAQALALKGVHKVLWWKDLPQVPHTTSGVPHPEPAPYDTCALNSTVRYKGEPVALIAAESEALADQALKLVRVEYEVLPAVFEISEAVKPGAPQLHTQVEIIPGFKTIYDPAHNIAAHGEYEFGDVEAAFSAADLVIERHYETPTMCHCALEPHASLAFLDAYDRLNVVTSTQVPFHVRRQLARALDLPLRRIRITKPRVGGGFGGKQEMVLEPLAAALALATRRPVRLVLPRNEEFSASRVRHAASITMRAGITRDGKITALEMRASTNTGAYASHADTVAHAIGHKTLGLYRAQAYRYIGDAVYTNRPVAGAFRGYGATQGYFALESFIDELAWQIKLDPLEFRRRNHTEKGGFDPMDYHPGLNGLEPGRSITSCALPECLEQGAKLIGWGVPRPVDKGPVKRGLGMAICMQGSGVAKMELGGATLKLNDDGSFNLLTGATDIGQGSDTVLSQIAAEVLGISLENIILASADTDLTVMDYGAYASSTTYITGMGVKRAAEDARRQILAVAAEMCETDPASLSIKQNEIWGPFGKTGLAVSDVAFETLYGRHRTQIVGKGDATSKESPPPFYAQFVEVAVDTETGLVQLLRSVNVLDLGRAVNPALASGQVEGAVTMGFGYALTEELRFDDQGTVRNAGFVDYKVFSPLDMPEMQTVLVEDPDPTGPFGLKSAGEVGINGPAPAIANAIFNATGLRLRSLPMTPGKVLEGLENLTGPAPDAPA